MGSKSSKHGKLEDEFLSIVTRKEWGARKAFHRDSMRVPVSQVIFHATPKITAPWWDKEKFYKQLQILQEFHMYQRLFPDVQYNFMVDENGTIYEGRGWFTKATAQPAKKPYNMNAIYIGYVGDIGEDGPTDPAMKAGNDLISFGMRHEYINYHHHIDGLITGIVGTTLEECKSRNKKWVEPEPPSQPPGPVIQDQFYMG